MYSNNMSFFIVGNKSIKLASRFSKIDFSRRSLIVQLSFSAKTAPNELFLEECLMLLLF